MRTISRRLLAGVLLAMVLSGVAYSQGGQYGPARDLVSRVQNDLRNAEKFTRPNDKEKDRYFNAQHRLSQFDKALSKGKFDKDKLDQSIDHVKNVVENNTLSANDRDALTADLRDLRELRKNRG